MEKRPISYKTSNRVYLWVVILILVSGIPSSILIYMIFPGTSETFIAGVVQEIYIIAPIVAILTCREKPNEIVGFHKFRPSSVVWILLLVVLLEPIIQFLSIIMSFPEWGAASEIAESDTVIQTLFGSCLLAPFCEEFVFRGVMFPGYKKSCSFLTSIILTSVCFGLLHADLYQLLYTMVGGFFFALVLQATGSFWASFVAHALNNTLTYFFWPSLFGFFTPDTALSDTTVPPTVGIMIAVIVLSLILTPVALLVVRKIAKGEGRENPLNLLKGSQRKQGEKNHFITPALIIACVILILELIMNTIQG